MNGVNNQLINSVMAQDSNAATSPNHKSIQKRKWTQEENKRFIELKQQEPNLSWKAFAKHFPSRTTEQCSSHWHKVLEPRLGKRKRIRYPGIIQDSSPDNLYEQIQKRELEGWSEEENKQFITLKQQQPELSWQDLTQYFPRKTSEECESHWNKVLVPHLYADLNLGLHQKTKLRDPTAGTKLWTEEENKRFFELKQQEQKLRWKDFAKHFPGRTDTQCRLHWETLLERKQKMGTLISSSKADGSTSCNSKETDPSKQSSLNEPAKIAHKQPLDLFFYHYEVAVNHFQEIQLKNPLLQSIQQEAAQCLANVEMTYLVIKQRLATEKKLAPILEQVKPLIKLCQTNTYYLKIVYQHFISYQANQESKEWFSSQSIVFANLYSAFLKGNMDEVHFHHLISLKDRDYSYQDLTNLFIRLQDALKNQSSFFSLEYNKFINDLFSSIEFQLNLLRDNQQNWRSMASSLGEILSRLQEIEIFLQSFFDPISSSEMEINIIARLKNEISLQDFYAKQAALMAIQKEKKQAENSIPLHEPSQIQEDFLSNPLFSPPDGLMKIAQKTFRDRQTILLDLSFYHYEVAVSHLQEIQLTSPLFQSVQHKVAQCLANRRITYQVIKQRLAAEENLLPILEQAKPLIKLCKASTYYFEMIYQHFLSYQATQESKDWFISQSKEFAYLYFAFLKGKIDEIKFRDLIFLKKRDYLISLKERNDCRQKLNNLSIRLQDILKKYSLSFNLEEYYKFIEELYSGIEFQLDLLLKENQQNWKSIVSVVEETLSRLQEIEIFFQSSFDPIPPIETEANIIARLKNEISLEDFYKKQAVLTTVQTEEKQAEHSISLHESSEIQEDFFSSSLFS